MAFFAAASWFTGICAPAIGVGAGGVATTVQDSFRHGHRLAYASLGLSAAALGLAVTPLVRALGSRLGVVDEPGGRRVHDGRVPRLGGVAVLVATLAALALGWVTEGPLFERLFGQEPGLRWLLAGTLTVVGVGVVDDVWSVGPLTKLAIQTVAAVLALAGGYGFNAVTNPFTSGYIDFGPFGSVVTLLWIVGITNAFNLIDGLDGLAAGVGLIVAATVFIASLLQGRPDIALLALTLAGTLVGFLYYNFFPASIFLGDSGSFLVGYVLAILSIQGRGKGPAAVVILVPILAMAFPITDTVVTVVRRFVAAGAPALFRADREHIHHRLVKLGMTPRRAVLLLYAVCCILAVLALLAVAVRGPGSAILLGMVLVAGYLGVRRLGYAIPGRNRTAERPQRAE
jgi:UDP-GlcNAc:undecaprenyl-phosphate/decaprenyl-phosphate GlcNAc-1-phosphate transferase